MDRCKWRKVIKEARWSGWVWVSECFFWYRPTRVVPDQRPLNGCCCCCCCYWSIYWMIGWLIYWLVAVSSVLWHCWLDLKRRAWTRPQEEHLACKKLSNEVLVWLSVCLWSSWCHCIPKPCHLLPHLNPDWFCLSGTGLPRSSWNRGC